jgi:hypothetical protein
MAKTDPNAALVFQPVYQLAYPIRAKVMTIQMERKVKERLSFGPAITAPSAHHRAAAIARN